MSSRLRAEMGKYTIKLSSDERKHNPSLAKELEPATGRRRRARHESRPRVITSLPARAAICLSGMVQTELEESNRQFIAVWTAFARRAASGEVAELPGLTVASCRVSMPLMNAIFLSSKVADAADLERRVGDAGTRGDASGYRWTLIVCEEWIRSPGQDAERVFLDAGLKTTMRITGMVADALLPPRRPLPALETRLIADHETLLAMSDLNCVAYNLPLAWGHEAYISDSALRDDVFGVVGYVDGTPVTTATTMVIDGVLYVALVATAAEHRAKGYAEVATRRSLEAAGRATGLSRTVLHASEAGYPLYLAMGYRPAATFRVLARAGQP